MQFQQVYGKSAPMEPDNETETQLKLECDEDDDQTIHNDDDNFPTKSNQQQSCQFYCRYCRIKFFSQEHYNLHKQSYHPKCQVCKAQYKDRNSLRSHQKRDHSFYECPSCKACFASAGILLKHLQSLRDSALFKCDKPVCTEERFHSIGEYWKHKYEEHEMARCVICAQRFGNRSRLHRHMKDMHQIETIRGKIFSVVKPNISTQSYAEQNAGTPDLGLTTSDIKEEGDNNIHPSLPSVSKHNERLASNCNKPNCSYCAIIVEDGANKANNENVMEHSIQFGPQSNQSYVPIKPKPNFGPAIFINFAFKGDLINHQQNINKENPQLYKCERENCGLIFSSEDELLNHTTTEHMDKKCIICGLGVKTDIELNMHLINVHQVEIIHQKMTHVMQDKNDLDTMPGQHVWDTVSPNATGSRNDQIPWPYTLGSDQITQRPLQCDKPDCQFCSLDLGEGHSNKNMAKKALESDMSQTHNIPEDSITCSKCLSIFRDKVKWERHIWKCKRLL